MSEQLWRCGRCLEHKAASAFGNNSDSLTSDKRPVSYICRDCMRRYQQMRHKQRSDGTWSGWPIRRRSQLKEPS